MDICGYPMDICSAIGRFLWLARPASSPGCETFNRANVEQISDHVFQIGTKPERSSAEVVFFHGLQLTDEEDAHITTWLCRDKTQVWLHWLVAEFPDVRILIVRYDASTKKTTKKGRMDMFVTCENVLGDLNRARVGEVGYPIILVGHCLGGLILKQICVQADSSIVSRESADFLKRIRAVLFFASPNHGSELPDSSIWYPKGCLFEDVAPLYAKRARLNEHFRKLRGQRKWITVGLGESRPVSLGNFNGLIVPEASARHDVDSYYTVDADHFDVCRPDSEACKSYTLLRDLVGEIIKKDEEAMAIPNNLLDNIVGLEKNLETIQRKLVEKSRVAIVGMGGIGKTTLAEAVFQNIGKNFHYSCFYKEVKNSMGEKESADVLRDNIKKHMVDKRGHKVHESFRWNELEGKKVLVVLDDVISASQTQVMMVNDKFHKESRVVITTRDKQFIQTEKLNFDLYEVDTLDADSSSKLFCLCAFGKEDPPAEFCEETERIVKKCEGHPLTLTITGKYLHCQDESVWDEVFTKLRDAKPLNGKNEDGLWSLLRPSVDSLARDEKEMFLDVAVCFHGNQLMEIKKIWKVCGWGSPGSGWRNLLDRHLVKEQEKYGTAYIYMHEVLRDLGRNIAGRSRMLVSDLHLVNTFSTEQAAEVKVVKGNIEESDYSREKNLCKLTNMKVLWLTVDRKMDTINHGEWMEPNWSAPKGLLFARVRGANNSTLTKICGLQSPHVVEASRSWIPGEIGVLQSLKDLNISWCMNLRAIPAEIGRLQNLQNLDISHCSELEAIPAEISKLQSLRVLRISWCQDLVKIPEEIRGLQSLQDLDISRCRQLRNIPAGIGALQSLRVLNMSYCESLLRIPREIGALQNLQNLDMSYCRKLREIPAGIGGLRSLRVLNMSGLITILQEVPRLRSLEDLNISRCGQLREIPAGIGGLRSLRVLNMSGCVNVATISEEIGGLRILEELDMSGCEELREIPAGIGGLQRLRILNMSGCEGLITIPQEVHGLRSLEDLNISRCLQLREIPAGIGGLRSLRVLNMSGCVHVATISEEIGGLQRLRILNMSGCEGLITIPQEVHGLRSLEDLNISWCTRLREIPTGIGGLRSLRVLNMSACVNLKTISEEIGGLRILEELDMSECEKLREIPAGIGGLRSLRVLNMSGCVNVATISDKIGGLRILQELDMSGCEKLREIPAGIGGLQRLRILNMSGCEGLITIPQEVHGLRSLEDLNISRCLQLREIPAGIGGLRSLRVLNMSGCVHVATISEEIGGLQRLRILNMSGCEGLITIPQEVHGLRSLEDLNISGCRQLREIPIGIGGLHSLRVLNMSACVNLETISEEIGGLRILEELDMSKCEKLREIPAGIGGLQSLRVLNMLGCFNVSTIPEEIGELRILEDLDMSKCGKLREIPAGIGGLQRLRILNISHCKNLVRIPEEIVGLRSLQDLNMSFCSKLITISAEIGRLQELQQLDISYCFALARIPVEIGELQSLQKLHFVGNLKLVIPTQVRQRQSLMNDCSREGNEGKVEIDSCSEDPTWRILEDAIHKRFNHMESGFSSYEYRTKGHRRLDEDHFKSNKDKYSLRLVITMFQHLRGVANMVEAAQEELFLEAINSKWMEFSESLTIISDLWDPAIRDGLYRMDKLPDALAVYEMGHDLWTENILRSPQIRERLLRTLRELSERERRGETINRGLMRSIAKMFKDLGPIVYLEDFESQFRLADSLSGTRYESSDDSSDESTRDESCDESSNESTRDESSDESSNESTRDESSDGIKR